MRVFHNILVLWSIQKYFRVFKSILEYLRVCESIPEYPSIMEYSEVF